MKVNFFPFTQCERWPFRTVPAPAAEETCTRLASSIWHMYANWLCLCRLSKTRIRWGEGKSPNHPSSNGGKCQRNHSAPLIIQNTFKRLLTLHGTSKSGPEESRWCHNDAITSKGRWLGGHVKWYEFGSNWGFFFIWNLIQCFYCWLINLRLTVMHQKA